VSRKPRAVHSTPKQQARKSREESWARQDQTAKRGKQVIRRNVSRRNLRCSDVLRALERAAAATGDPVFDDALRALRAYGFDSGGIERAAKRAERDLFYSMEIEYLRQIKWLLERPEKDKRTRRASSVLEAAECVAAESFVRGPSFDSVVERLRKSYAQWQREGYPSGFTTTLTGDLQYKMLVKPVSEQSVPLMPDTSMLPAEGLEQQATAWWRRLFREGAVTLQFLSES